MDPLRRIIRGFDDWLSLVEGVAPFTDDRGVILRAQAGTVAWTIPLSGGIIPRGSPVLMVHLWNERMPPIGAAGADLAWAIRTERALVYSFQEMGGYLGNSPRLHSVRAVGGVIAQIHLQGPDGGRALLEHLGFTIYPYHRHLGAFGEFWENFFTWWLMWTYNPPSVHHRGMFDLQRGEFWMTREHFLRRFARR